jgi:aryl-alcohol dehydrogenase-like predicted oxidoreductase
VRLVLGTADLRDEALSSRLLDQFYDAGGRAIDVANVYGDGESERVVGKWLRTRRVRDDVILYGKGCHPPYCSPELVGSEVDRALELLGVERLDVFMLHRDDPDVRVQAFAAALRDQVVVGKIGGFGVSNWAPARFVELRDGLESGGNELVAFSNHFSLGEMVTPTWPGCLGATKGELERVLDTGVEFIAWASLAMGYFAGRDAPNWQSPVNSARRERASALATELGSTANAVALAYVLHQPARVRPVIGTRSEDHLAEALGAEEIRLTPEQAAWLERGAEMALGAKTLTR